MSKGEIDVKKSDTLFDELDRLQDAVSRRAYELFQHGGTWGGALTDWLSAERELISKPAVELRQREGQFDVTAAVPGIEAKDLHVQIAPDALLIKGETTHENTTDTGTVHISEFGSGQVFRTIRFPEAIDPNSAKAEHKNGMLHVTVTIAKAAIAKKVDIKAA